MPPAAPRKPRAGPGRVATVGRYGIEDVLPVLAHGRRPAKAVVGEAVQVFATLVAEGHDRIGADAVLLGPGGEVLEAIRMAPVRDVPDRRSAWLTMPTEEPSGGLLAYRIEAWGDPLATWWHRAGIKIPAALDVELELREGVLLYEQALKALPRGGARQPVKAAVAAMRDASLAPAARLAAAIAPQVVALLTASPIRLQTTSSADFPIRVERERALYGSWYEFFPRSEGIDGEHGTFATAARRLPAIAAMGFDVVYLPPVHPIGRTERKGRNNTLPAGPDDVGVPWAIGSADGGHDAIHPQLGTIDDFDAFVDAAAGHGLEIALDLALQASPDHPWVREHPEWFAHRADGTIAYAENPPKRYQDIYPIHFDTDPEGLHDEVLRIVRYWMAHGVRIFRVDNPHTKPVAFWERLIAEVNATDPDVMFLAEAFTRPGIMRLLGEVGFQQSYTYFTWRNTKWELEQYFRELSGPLSASMRPNCFVNTQDILTEYLQYGGPAAFAIRATLAATLSPTWGVYSGFELYEHVALRPGSEEYLDSEKYQLRQRDWAAAEASGRTLAPYLTALNDWRRAHPALHRLRNLHFHPTDSDQVIAYSKREGDDCVLVVCTLDPHGARETTVHLDLDALGVTAPLAVRDLVSGERYLWGERAYVRLDPHVAVAHVLVVDALPADGVPADGVAR